MTDYYSYYPAVYDLKRTNTLNVIHTTKAAFSRHGIPEIVVSDNGSQYTSKYYQPFARDWQFQHRTSSPRYARFNGLAESSVKVLKNLIKKCKSSTLDILKGLLIHRSTPLGYGKSLTEFIMGRKLSNVPFLESEKQNVTRDLVTERKEQKKCFDRKSTSKRNIASTGQFMINEKVAIAVQDPKNRRSYKIEVDNGNILRRNPSFIRKAHTLLHLCLT